MVVLLVKIFIIAFFINLLYEILHSLLYKTCLESPLKKYVYLILKAAIFDGFSITVMYYFTFFIFKKINPFDSNLQIISFSLISLLFAYIWEIYAIKNKRWEYSSIMPIIWGVGITPFFQLAITGFLSLYFVFYFY